MEEIMIPLLKATWKHKLHVEMSWMMMRAERTEAKCGNEKTKEGLHPTLSYLAWSGKKWFQMTKTLNAFSEQEKWSNKHWPKIMH